jgi:hypothetical protein
MTKPRKAQQASPVMVDLNMDRCLRLVLEVKAIVTEGYQPDDRGRAFEALGALAMVAGDILRGPVGDFVAPEHRAAIFQEMVETWESDRYDNPTTIEAES